MAGPAFYAYMAPEPPDYGGQQVKPGFYDGGMHEFFLLYDDVRRAKSPRSEILQFAQSSYVVGAELAGWDRELLERKEPH